MKQARLSNIFSSSKRKTDDYVRDSHKRVEQIKSKVNFNDTGIKMVLATADSNFKSKHGITPMKIDSQLKSSARKSKCKHHLQPKPYFTGKATGRTSKSKLQTAVIHVNAKQRQISNENIDINSVKNLDSNFEVSQNQQISNNNKRVKVEEDRTESSERVVKFKDTAVASTAKHTFVSCRSGEAELSVKQVDDGKVPKQVTFATGQEVNTNFAKPESKMKRAVKHTNKQKDSALDWISSTSLSVLRRICSLKNRSLETVKENNEEDGEKCASGPTNLPSLTEENKAVKSENLSPSKNNFKSPKRVGPPSIASLSKNTLDILKKIKKSQPVNKNTWVWDQNKTELDRKVDKILDGPSMSEKYEELISDKGIQLITPAHFKILINALRACDQCIHFLKKRGKLLKFEDISASVEASTNRKFSLTHFCQILRAVPTMYSHEWRRVTGERSHSLIIDIPAEESNSSECTNIRVDKLKIELMKITAEYHKTFLKQLVTKRPSLREYLEDFDPFEQKWWYHEFDPHNPRHVPQLKPLQLNNMPTEKRSESVGEFLKRNRSSQKRESLNRCSLLAFANNSIEKAQPNALANMHKPEVKEVKEPAEINGIPADLYNRIKAKQQVYTSEKKQQENDYKTKKFKIMKESLLKMIDSIKSIYSVRRVNTLNISKLMGELQDNQRGVFEESTNILDRIKQLHFASPKWMKIISLPSDKFVKINKDYKKSSVKIDIERYVEKLEKEEAEGQKASS